MFSNDKTRPLSILSVKMKIKTISKKSSIMLLSQLAIFGHIMSPYIPQCLTFYLNDVNRHCFKTQVKVSQKWNYHTLTNMKIHSEHPGGIIYQPTRLIQVHCLDLSTRLFAFSAFLFSEQTCIFYTGITRVTLQCLTREPKQWAESR